MNYHQFWTFFSIEQEEDLHSKNDAVSLGKKWVHHWKDNGFFYMGWVPIFMSQGRRLVFYPQGRGGGLHLPLPPLSMFDNTAYNFKVLTICCLPARGPCWSATPPTSAWPGTPTPWSTCPRTAILSLKPCATCAGFQGAWYPLAPVGIWAQI